LGEEELYPSANWTKSHLHTLQSEIYFLRKEETETEVLQVLLLSSHPPTSLLLLFLLILTPLLCLIRMLKLPRSTNNLHTEEENDTSRCPMQVLGHHEPNVILKDNDLKHKIRLPGVTAKFLLHQLEKDSELLCSFGVMDYSLLGTWCCLRDSSYG
jgi:hypothetical protein